MKIARPYMLFAGLAALACAQARADAPLESELEACAALDSPDERLACFDALSRSDETREKSSGAADPPGQGPLAPAETAPAHAAPAAGTATRPLGDDVGKRTADDDDNEDEPAYAATLVRCEVQGPSERTYFFFENGQVWRQSNSNRLRLRDCGGEVQITRDFFGYKLYIPDQERTIRVRRVR